VNVVASLEPAPKTAKLVQPRIRALDHPSEFSKSAAVVGPPFGDVRRDPPRPQGLPMSLGIVGAVGVQAHGAAPRVTYLAADRRDRIDQGDDLRDVVGIGSRNNCRHGEAMTLRKDMVFAAVLAPIRGARACFFPRATARIELESTTARSQSNWSASLSLSKRARWILSQSPDRFHWRNRLQHVMPEQPISAGRSSQGIPVLSTKRIPASATRCSTGLRPGNRKRLRFGGGNSGCRNSQNSSVMTGRAMRSPLSVPHMAHRHLALKTLSFC